MKLLPFVAAAAAEKRFLTTAGKARIDTNKNLLFDTAVNNTAGDAKLADAFDIAKGAVYIGGKDATNSVTGLVEGAVYRLALPASVTDAKWKTNSRLLGKAADGAAVDAITQATLPDCSNKFIETKAASESAKSGADTKGTQTSGAKDADLKLKIDNTKSGLTNAAKAYLACSNKTAFKKPKILKCDTVYTVSDLSGADGTAEFKLTEKGASAKVKGSATDTHHTTDNSWTDMYFVEVASDTPKVLNVCTSKASASRMAAFVSGLIAYALLI